MIVECIEKDKGITIGEKYKVINSFGINNGFKLEIENDDGVYEEYERYLFKKID
jgi:hypothetical protein